MRAEKKLSSEARDARYEQLLALAEDGDEAAVGDLWREFGFEYREGVVE